MQLSTTEQKMLRDNCMPLLLYKPHHQQLDCVLFQRCYRDVLLPIDDANPKNIGRLFFIGPRKDDQSITEHSLSVDLLQNLQLFVLEIDDLYDLSIYNVTEPVQVKNVYASRGKNGVLGLYYSSQKK